MRKYITAAIAIALALLVATFTPFTYRAAAQAPQGPWIDELVFSQELDESKALTEIIAGNADTIMFDFAAPADRERALASDQVDTFITYGLYDEFTMNAAEQNQSNNQPRNPFAIRAVRESMQYLIDRDFIVREIYAGGAIPFKTPWHPVSGDYARAIDALLLLEDKYAFNPQKGKQQMFDALEANGWSIGTDGFWHDPEGRLVTITGLIRTQDERLQMGRYYADILRGLSFKVVNNEGPRVASIAYGGLPDENLWHFYTAGWIQTAFTAWDDGQLFFFAACGIGTPWCTPDFYQPPAELKDLAEGLLVADYNSLEERQAMIARATELAMEESLRVFIDVRQSLFAHNIRMEDITWDLFSGTVNAWALRSATVPADPVTGLRTSKILNLEMFLDGWNPWVSPGWLYDSVQRTQMIDEGTDPHPHTGRYIDWRNIVTVETAGPEGTLAVPSDALEWDTANSVWMEVGSGVTAKSKVTSDIILGSWHHGPDLTMQDVLYSWSNFWRRCVGDINATAGLTLACDPSVQIYERDILVAIKPLDDDTMEVYINYWHVDDREIAATGEAGLPSVPWEVGETAAKLLLDEDAVNSDGDIAATGRIWLDLTKGDSIPLLEAALATYTTDNHIPPGMAAGEGDLPSAYAISAADATARWTALNTWYTDRGHFWPSQGPWYLESVNVPALQSTFKAFRNHPFAADKFVELATVAVPTITFAPTPPVVFAGTPAVFDFSVTVGPAPTDDFTSTWFLRDASTGEFVDEGTPTRLGTGSYRIEIPAATTDELLLGTFEIISVNVGNAAAIPNIQRTSFLVLPSTSWFEALLDARAGLLESDIDALSGSLTGIESDVSDLSGATSGLIALVTAMTILAVIAIGIAVVSVILVLRRGPGGGT